MTAPGVHDATCHQLDACNESACNESLSLTDFPLFLVRSQDHQDGAPPSVTVTVCSSPLLEQANLGLVVLGENSLRIVVFSSHRISSSRAEIRLTK